MKPYFSKCLLNIFLVSSIVLGVLSVCPAMDTTVEKIANNKNSHDGQGVSVTGTVSGIKFGTLAGGNHYTTFILLGKSGGRVNVLISKRLKLKPRQKVTVTGTYRKVWKTAQRIFNHTIEASNIKLIEGEEKESVNPAGESSTF